MHIFMLVLTGGIMAMLLQFVMVDGVTGWIASRIILRPWQHAIQVLAVRYLYMFMYGVCVVIWCAIMVYLYTISK